PIVVADELSKEESARLMEVMRGVDGAGIVQNYRRQYPQGELAAHLLGYARRSRPGENTSSGEYSYFLPDWRGASGIERYWNDRIPGTNLMALSGIPGYSLVEVDNLGFVYRKIIEKIEPVHGSHLVLTLDSRAQRTAEALLKEKRGAFVLLEANTGRILAMASAPAFEPGKFSPAFDNDYYRTLASGSGRAFLNRAISGVYTPGSILKVLVALALLENGVDPQSTVFCDGASTVAGVRIRCASWRSGGHGAVTLVDALEHSCNDYFIEKGITLDPDQIRDVLSSAGLGKNIGALPGLKKGVFPSEEFKRRHYHAQWNSYDTALLSIGQGMVSITPLQAALFVSALANGGEYFHPYLVEKVFSTAGDELWRARPEAAGRLNASEEHIALVRQGMFQVVNSSTGSGRSAKTPAIELYGKTGSAEIGSRENRKVNAWFVAFGEKDGKRYAASLILEDAVSGGHSAAPLMARFFTEYLGAEPSQKTME
ncbi:MAG: penicillin-binding transpeptidase domain-containing protein, partial [Victivallaceae bacterium]|nr:penicillin-binding transpeptidase domain-containing protein [Victivallaceae bacterium]